ncbi:hypothetical protein BJV78DRAFT_1158601 [Lactifluus subvellereus]|nr:hypothetical protein BJV78DRAFT_1158601 [Lactifluus subvellereus]
MIQSKGNFSGKLLLGNQMSNSENLDVGLDVPLFPQQFPMPEVSRKQMRADKNSVVYRDATWSDSIKRWVLEDEEYGAPRLSPQKPRDWQSGPGSSKTSEMSRDAVAYDKTMALLIALLLTIDPQEMSDNEGPTCAAVAEGMHVQQQLGDYGDGCDTGDCGDNDTRNSCNGKVAMTPTAVMAASEWTLNMLVAASALVTAVGEGGCMSTTSLSKVCLTSTTKGTGDEIPQAEERASTGWTHTNQGASEREGGRTAAYAPLRQRPLQQQRHHLVVATTSPPPPAPWGTTSIGEYE